MRRPLHPQFSHFLQLKDQDLIKTYLDLRDFVLSIYPECNELLYRTHALTSVYCISTKLSDGFCHIPIYSAHLNLGFNKGNLLEDPDRLLKGTGKLIRHIPITTPKSYRNNAVKSLIKSSVEFAIEDMDQTNQAFGQTISKIRV